MFSSRRDKDLGRSNKDLPEAPAPTATPLASKRSRPQSAPSIISADMVMNGTIASTGDMQIDGRVEGDVRSVGLVVGDKAEIHGEIYAEDVTIRGKVVGRIHARKITLAATSHVEGDILHEAFSVESGAFFEGNCRHSDNPLGDVDLSGRRPAPVQATPAPAAQPATLFAPISQPANQTA